MDEWVFRSRNVCSITRYYGCYYISISPLLGYFV